MSVAPYGSWRSPITSDLIAASVVALGEPRVDGDDVYWLEGRAMEGGRQVVVRRTGDGRVADVTPPGFNTRTRVHEYGGASYAISLGVVLFSNFADQRLYRQRPDGPPVPFSEEAPPGALRYADLSFDPKGGRVFAVREDHRGRGEARNELVALDLASGAAAVLATGHDFYSSPRPSPDGRLLAWLSWDHPNMPWDGTELWVASLEGARLGDARRLAGGARESIVQPAWSPEGELHFVSDRTGWWNVYRRRDGRTEPLVTREAEFARPLWAFGQSTYAFLPDRRVAAAFTERGGWRLALLDGRGGLAPLELPYTDIAGVRAWGARLVLVAGAPAEPTSVVALDPESGRREVLRRSIELAVDPGYLSSPEPLEFPTEDGSTAHALFYRSRNRDFAGPAGERPPLLVLSHGGPTGAASSTLNLALQFWTSRGFAVLDVDYGGSTGYGRAYRERLRGTWGVVDVDDCVAGARDLARRGEVDAARLLIRGGSAGGYTTLAALTFRDAFRAGASHYGVSDLAALARDTHKFESRYLDGLVGPYPARRDLYEARSPIHHAERLARPVIFFQGLEDPVVPPAQAERMVAALRAKGIPVAYVPFEGEQHGFRKAEHIKRALDAELYFYSRILGFPLAEPVEPVPIENLP